MKSSTQPSTCNHRGFLIEGPGYSRRNKLVSLHFLEAPQQALSVNFSMHPPAETSKDVAAPRVAQYGRNLRWARISAILCLSSSNFFLSWAMFSLLVSRCCQA